MKLERQWWWWAGQDSAPDQPTDERYCGSSIMWMCTACGRNYAWMKALKNDKLQPFSFIHGVCNSCPGNRYRIPGSLECMTLINWPEVPKFILDYQLSVELSFLNHPDHPHNQGSYL